MTDNALLHKLGAKEGCAWSAETNQSFPAAGTVVYPIAQDIIQQKIYTYFYAKTQTKQTNGGTTLICWAAKPRECLAEHRRRQLLRR